MKTRLILSVLLLLNSYGQTAIAGNFGYSININSTPYYPAPPPVYYPNQVYVQPAPPPPAYYPNQTYMVVTPRHHQPAMIYSQQPYYVAPPPRRYYHHHHHDHDRRWNGGYYGYR